MAKNPNKKAKALQKDEQMNGAMKFFLAGCVAELYLLIIRRFYINADSELSRIAWYDRYLWMLAGIGAGVLAVGLIAALTAKANAGRRKTGWALAGAGAFVGIASALVRWNMATLSLMTIVVPVVILLGVLWALYDRECALALTVLGVALLALWGYRPVCLQYVCGYGGEGTGGALSGGADRAGRSHQAGEDRQAAARDCGPSAGLYLLWPVRCGAAGRAGNSRRRVLCHLGHGGGDFRFGCLLYRQAALILLIRAAPLLRSGSFFTHGQKVLREGCPQKQRKRFGKTEGKRRYSRALSVKRKKRRFLTAVAGNECIM